MDQTKAPGIKIVQVFLREAHFKHREDYLELAPNTSAEVGDVTAQLKVIASTDGRASLIQLTISTKPENNPIYEFTVGMSAIVHVDEKAPNMRMEDYVEVSAGAMLYPFVRQVVADLTWRARFGPIWLHPANLRALVKSKPLESPKKQLNKRTGAKRKKGKKKALAKKRR